VVLFLATEQSVPARVSSREYEPVTSARRGIGPVVQARASTDAGEARARADDAAGEMQPVVVVAEGENVGDGVSGSREVGRQGIRFRP
jgi:hypothetical protein